MAKRKTSVYRKKRLSQEEVAEIRQWMEGASPSRKPSIRQIAKAYGRTRPTIIKSLKGWRGVQRRRPQPEEEPRVIDPMAKPVIEPFVVEVD